MKNLKGVVVFLAGLLLAVCFSGTISGNGSNAVRATGSISGRVTNSVGGGIAGIEVEIYGLNYDFRRETWTDADGRYTISSLSSGSYVAYFGSYSEVYFSEWYSDKLSFATADPVEVLEGGTTSNVDAQLTKGGQISGRLMDVNGDGIQGGYVRAYSLDISWEGGSETDANGNYLISKLPTDNYKVFFSASNAPGFVPEWYDNQTGFGTANAVAVTVDNLTPNINAQLVMNGKISGRIIDLGGVGIPGVTLDAYDINNSQSPVGFAYTDSSGEYVMNDLPPGSYKIRFYRSGYYAEWFNDKASYQSADSVSVAAGSTTANINAQIVKMTTIDLSKTAFYFSAIPNGSITPAGSTVLSNSGNGTLNWTASSWDDWLSVSPTSGIGDSVISIGIGRTDLAPGTYYGTVAISDPNAWNSPVYVHATYQVLDEGADAAPFGSFDTPDNAGWLSSSVPVTGWALDDIGVNSVKIYLGWMDGSRTFIGDATFVEGARPDIESQYWDYPQNERAGWGYMLLTNFLPNGGNGVNQLLAYATDTEGHEVLLGSKMIMCDNANAVKPFGAIDTPAQGGIASGNAFFNFGWVLTPQPNSIPVDGSTINVWVDGLPLGHPVYNNYRADIATLFPGYANSNGAVGLFSLDTTGYSNGIHTIEWSATDTGGNTDGIGSRFFTIQNLGSAPTASRDTEKADLNVIRKGLATDSSIAGAAAGFGLCGRSLEEILAMTEDVQMPVFVRRGLVSNAPVEMILPEADGSIRISVPQVTRLAVYLNEPEAFETEEDMIERGKRIRSGIVSLQELDKSDGDRVLSRIEDRANRTSVAAIDSRLEMRSSARYEAYQLVGEELRPLPIGSSFDPETGAFYWQPGPGFRGEFRFMIVDLVMKTRKTLSVVIL